MSRITTDQVAELLAQDKAGRVTRENLQKFLLNPDGGTVYTVSVDYSTVYTVSVDYRKTIEEMVSAGRYVWKDDNITAKNFPVNGTGVVTVALELVHLDKAVSSEAVLAHLEANGMRPATVEELLVFGATYPEIQREFPVVCLGSSWVDPDGRRHVPYLSRVGSKRDLRLYWFGRDWYEVSRFLAVRKS